MSDDLSPRKRSHDDTLENKDDALSDWQTVGDPKRRKPNDKNHLGNYPSLTHSTQARLNSAVKISDLQNLILYLFADGSNQQWISVQHRHSFDKIVVLMLPGLDMDLLHPHDSRHLTRVASPDDYYPIKLDRDSLSEPLRPLADIFEHVWPVKTPGDLTHMRSPLTSMLSATLPKPPGYNKKSGPKPPLEAKHWKNEPTPVGTFVATKAQLLDNGFALHPVHLETDGEREAERARRHKAFQGPDDGWLDIPENATSAGDEMDVLVVDCEMVTTTTDKFALARVSLVNWKGETILDQLVKPPDPITDYLTQYSGITPELLADVTTTLFQVQQRVRSIMTPKTILAGHSLDSDFKALKIACPFVVDTSILYPHPKGPPTKSSLKWLCEKYLGKSIQNHGSKGHDSVEDALSCLALIKQKCERGQLWGTSDATNEPLFKRLARPVEVSIKNKDKRLETEIRPGKTSAVVDWGDPMRGFGAAATLSIACEDDTDVVSGVKRAVEEVDFVWARMRQLEALRGWWNSSKTGDGRDRLARELEAARDDLSEATGTMVSRIQKIWSSLPPRTALIVYSGSGDPRDMSRLMEKHSEFKKAYQTMKWDELPVRWTDVEEEQLKTAVAKARGGIGLLAVTPAA